jgi:hypothetical protein
MDNPAVQSNSPEEDQERSPASALGDLQNALVSIASGIQDVPQIPKEAKVHLGNAVKEYSAFMSMASQALGVSAPDAGQQAQKQGLQPADAQGMSGAVPAGQPSGNARAVPA